MIRLEEDRRRRGQEVKPTQLKTLTEISEYSMSIVYVRMNTILIAHDEIHVFKSTKA